MSNDHSLLRFVQMSKLVTVVGLVTAFFVVPSGVSSVLIWVCLAIFYANFWSAVRKPQRIAGGTPTFATIEVLFFVFYFILFYLPYQLYVLGKFDLNHSAFATNTFADKTNPALICATIGLVAFSMGIGMISDPGPSVRPETSVLDPARDRYRSLGIAVFALLVGFIGIYLATGLRSSGEGRYSGTTTGGVVADGMALIITVLSMTAFALVVVRIKERQSVPLAHALAAGLGSFWALRILLLGDRNDFLLIAVVAIAGLLTFRLRAGRFVLTALMVFALLLYNAVQVERTSGSHSASALWSAFVHPQPRVAVDPSRPGNDNSFDISTIELRATFAAVPDQYPYGFGRYQLIGLAGLVPLVRGALLGSRPGFISTTQLLTTVVIGPNAGHTIGTNMISDLYIDFGIAGVPVGMFLFGLFAGSIRRRAFRHPASTPTIVFYLVTLSLYTQLPRYAAAFVVQPLGWLLLLLWITKVLSQPTNTGTRPAEENVRGQAAAGDSHRSESVTSA